VIPPTAKQQNRESIVDFPSIEPRKSKKNFLGGGSMKIEGIKNLPKKKSGNEQGEGEVEKTEKKKKKHPG